MTAVKDDERAFKDGPGVRRLDEDERDAVLDAYGRYLETIPEQKRQHSVSYEVKDVVGRVGFGIGSAGLPAYNLLVEGRSQALENDVVLSMKQGNVAAPSRVVDDERITEYFEHPGHRTAISQRALQAHADPWLGWCDLHGRGQVVQEISPYEADLDWDHVSEPDEMLPLLRCLGQATAKIHCVSDAGSSEELVDFQTEEAIHAVLDDDFAESWRSSARTTASGCARTTGCSWTPSATAGSRPGIRSRRGLNPAALGGDEDRLCAVHGAELRVGVVEVRAHGARRQLQLVRDLLVDLALGQPLQHVDLAGRERARVDVALGVAGALRQLVHDLAQLRRWRGRRRGRPAAAPSG